MRRMQLPLIVLLSLVVLGGFPDKNGPLSLAQSARPISEANDRDRQRDKGLFLQTISGSAWLSSESLETSLKIDQEGLSYAQQQGNREGEAYFLQHLGSIYYFLGEYQQALKFTQQSLALAQQLSRHGKDKEWLFRNQRDRANLLHNLGVIYAHLAQYPQALEAFERSLAIRRENTFPSWSLDNRSKKADTLNALGSVYAALGQPQQAMGFFRLSLELHRTFHNQEGEAPALGNLGKVYDDLGQYQQAIDLYQKALEIKQENDDRQGEAIALSNLGTTLFKTGQLADAETTLLAAIQVQESLRQPLSDANRVSIFETQVHPYNTLQQVRVSQDKPNAALEIAERGRARAFVDLLAKRLSANSDAPSNLTPPTLQHIRAIAAQQNATLVEYSILWDEHLYIWVVQPTGEINFRSVDLHKLQLSLNDLIPETRQALGVRNRSPYPQPAVRQRLAFAVGDRVRLISDAPDYDPWEIIAVDAQSDTLSLTQSSFPPGVTIERPANDVATKVETHRAKHLRLQQLHQLLIDPIADLLPAEPAARVIFMPQRELFLVPFPALQNAQGTYLIEKHTVLTAPAIQVLDLTRQRRQRLTANTPHSSSVFRPPFSVLPSPSNLLIVGNPTMPKVAWVPGDPPQPLTALPHAEQEARAIAQLLQTTALTGNQATKAAVLAKLPAARAIHLATHGLLDDRRGLGSAIALAPAAGDDGLLTAEEILDLNLKAELVVLSACNTGKGRITGDGVIGLSRALINTGVPSVIVSLWTVPDAPTASLMTAFYENLQQSGDKAQALRQAMLTTLQHHPDPRDWAAFTLIGEAK